MVVVYVAAIDWCFLCVLRTTSYPTTCFALGDFSLTPLYKQHSLIGIHLITGTFGMALETFVY